MLSKGWIKSRKWNIHSVMESHHRLDGLMVCGWSFILIKSEKKIGEKIGEKLGAKLGKKLGDTQKNVIQWIGSVKGGHWEVKKWLK